MTKSTSFSQWERNISRVQLPKWKELPTLGLYVDQVATVINEPLISLGLEPITKSMINNYVKKKVIQSPVKKKYAVNQIVDLLLIGLLKSCFSIEEIRTGIAQVTVKAYPQAAYDRFVEILNAELAGQEIPQMNDGNPDNDRLMKWIVETLVNRLKAEQLLKDMYQHQAPVDLDD